MRQTPGVWGQSPRGRNLPLDRDKADDGVMKKNNSLTVNPLDSFDARWRRSMQESSMGLQPPSTWRSAELGSINCAPNSSKTKGSVPIIVENRGGLRMADPRGSGWKKTNQKENHHEREYKRRRRKSNSKRNDGRGLSRTAQGACERGVDGSDRGGSGVVVLASLRARKR